LKVALIDNGSLEPAAHRHLRALAAALSRPGGPAVTAVSWKHSDRIAAADLDGEPACTLESWVRRQVAAGERELVFVPFFISPQGAIGSALRRDLERLAGAEERFSFRFTSGLAEAGALAPIAAARVAETIAAHRLHRPPVILVDHGGPAPASAALRDEVARTLRARLGRTAGPVAAASMESPSGPQFEFNRPLLADQLQAPGFAEGPVVIAPLFLSPGRHAGPQGDLARIAAAARTRAPAQECHFCGLVGTHPLAAEALAAVVSQLRVPAPDWAAPSICRPGAQA
jgi:sirohydrochlorin ferrochelatase